MLDSFFFFFCSRNKNIVIKFASMTPCVTVGLGDREIRGLYILDTLHP